MLAEELEHIEFQAGLGKHQSNETHSATSVKEKLPTPMEEGEENRDPNHEVEDIREDETLLPNSPICETQELMPTPISLTSATVEDAQEMMEDVNND